MHYHTIRAAYHLLEERGLVTVQPMIGTVVKEFNPFTMPDQDEIESEKLVAVLLPSLSDFYQQIFNGMSVAAKKHGIIPVILPCGENPEYAERLYGKIKAKGFSGVINISLGFSDSFFEKFHQSGNMGVPLVLLDVNEPDTHKLVIDTKSSICMATEHMIDHGYDTIGLINCPADWPVGQAALEGFTQALKNKDVSESRTSIYTVPNFNYEAGKFVAESILHEGSLPRAVVTVSDDLALGLISVLQKRGVKVPEDIAIIGYNDIFLSSVVAPPLSTVALPLYDMGVQSMEAMYQVMSEDMTFWIEQVFSGRLIKRASCGCHPTGGKNEEEKK